MIDVVLQLASKAPPAKAVRSPEVVRRRPLAPPSGVRPGDRSDRRDDRPGATVGESPRTGDHPRRLISA